MAKEAKTRAKKPDDADTLTIGDRQVRVTHPGKPYFSRERASSPSWTLVDYYLAVAPGALQGIRDRPIVLKRFVNGAEGEAFYQKRAPDNRPDWLRTVTLSFPSGRTAEEVVVDDAAGLAWVVNLGCIELHPHAVRAGDLDHPDELRVDLDPGPGVAWDDVRRVALEVKALLEEMGLTGWPKTSGSRGMHVNVRIHPRWTFTEVRRAALALSREIERRAPGARDVEVVEGGTPRRLPRLQPERQGPHDLLGLLRAPAARRARVGAAGLERGRRLRPGRLHRRDDAGAFRARSAIRTPRWTRAAGSLDGLLELAARDEAAGLGDAPWPPHFAQDGGRGAARGAVARAQAGGGRHRESAARAAHEDAARHRRQLAEQGRGAGRARTLEGAAPRGRRATSRSTTCWSTPCAAARRPGPASASTCATSPRTMRPPQETPDPDDDPTREWRKQWAARKQDQP